MFEMKRQWQILGGVLAAASIVIAYAVLAGAESTADPRGGVSLSSTDAASSDLAQGDGPHRGPLREVDTAVVPDLDEPHTAKLSSADQRVGESDTIFGARQMVLRSYQKFRQEAGMSAEQERKVLRILADAQHEWAQLAVYHGSLLDPALMRDEVNRDPLAVFNEEFEVRLGEVLSDDQVAAFRKHIGGAYQFSSFAPLNVPLPPELERYGEIRE